VTPNLQTAISDAVASQWPVIFAGAVLGFFAARAAAWRDRKVQSRKIARNLSQETTRLRDELGREGSKIIDVNFDGLSFAVPKIHPWMTALVPEAAMISGNVVGLFLTLDRELHNLKVHLGAVEKTTGHWMAMQRPSEQNQLLSKADREAIEKREDAVKVYRDSRSTCFRLLDEIDKLLAPTLRPSRLESALGIERNPKRR
jgi:hypothetical protein